MSHLGLGDIAKQIHPRDYSSIKLKRRERKKNGLTTPLQNKEYGYSSTYSQTFLTSIERKVEEQKPHHKHQRQPTSEITQA